jgi:F-type H+-transporting ATPase subunit a
MTYSKNAALGIFVSSPLEQFEVTAPFGSFNAPILGDFNLSLTNLGLYAIITTFLVLGMHIIANNSHALIPSKWSVALETRYASVHGIVRDQIGVANEIYTPFIYSLFFFLIVANLNGNIPYSYTVTTSAIVCLGLSVMIFLAVTILGLSIHGVHFFSFFIPAGTPLGLVPMLVLIELISYLARAVSLGVRLFSNMVAGHTLMTIIPFAIFVALIGLELAVSVIQAYVFCVLTSSYIRDAIELH